LVLRGVVDCRAGLERAGVDAKEDELADALVVHDLERERGERRVIGRLSLFERPRLGIDALDRRDTERRRQVVDDRGELPLGALGTDPPGRWGSGWPPGGRRVGS